MQNDKSRGNQGLPTECGTAGRPDGRDDSPENSSTDEKPPREDAAARTGGCTGHSARPVGPSGRDADNPTDVDEGVEILEAGSEAGDARAGSQLAERLQVASAFDEAERNEPTPDTLETSYDYGHRLRLEGEKRAEWLRTTYAVKLGEIR